MPSGENFMRICYDMGPLLIIWTTKDLSSEIILLVGMKA